MKSEVCVTVPTVIITYLDSYKIGSRLNVLAVSYRMHDSIVWCSLLASSSAAWDHFTAEFTDNS